MMQVEKSDFALSAIVLAGGQSSRMGRDKALIAPQGVPLLRQVYEIAMKCASPVYVVTPWPTRYQDVLPNSCRFIQEVPLPNETEPHGPLVGLAQGLAQVQTQWVLVLACDLPLLRVEVLHSWMALLDEVRDDAIALLPRDAKGWQPLCGFYRPSCLPALTDFINQGGRSFQHWLSQHPVQEVPVSDRQMLFNCNTPTDLEQVQREQ